MLIIAASLSRSKKIIALAAAFTSEGVRERERRTERKKKRTNRHPSEFAIRTPLVVILLFVNKCPERILKWPTTGHKT